MADVDLSGLQIVDGDRRVLRDIVEERGHDRGRIELELGDGL